MPLVEPTNLLVKELSGLHLYHAGWSNCSMRARMVLEEKGLAWTSHHMDLRAGEHITPEYFGIHPKGLVPALVHDGAVWVESGDIIKYLDATFRQSPLTPLSAEGRELLHRWAALASQIHVRAVKTYVYCKRAKPKATDSQQNSDKYKRLQKDPELLQFHERRFCEEGLGEKDQKEAEEVIHQAFSELDDHLEGSCWLAGESFSLADIFWIPLYYTLTRVGLSVDDYEYLHRWSKAIEKRRSYQVAVVQWYDGPPT